ncbi:MAG: cupredoxin domain-containing protein [Gemmatimonadaceae bacterium]
MTPADWGVLFGGVILSAWINWYFFFSEKAAVTASASAGGLVEAQIVVHGGYAPNVIRVPAGRRVRLIFDRQETSSCSEEVVFPSLGIRRFLPAFQKTTVDLAPQDAGRVEFTCGMSMLRGALIVEKGQ